MRLSKRVLSAALSLTLAATMLAGTGRQASGKESKAEQEESASQQYVEAMAPGWNLGNTLEAYDTNRLSADIRETSWGQPKVVKEVFENVKEAGYNSVRIPVTFDGCYGDASTGYKIDKAWLARIREVVQMALDSDLYAILDMHGDAWIWMNSWDGDTASEKYETYCALWEQIAEYFKDMDEKLSFETINEPNFSDDAEARLEKINAAAYKIIRKSGGKNATRMIILPTLNTSHDNCEPLYHQMTSEFLVDGKRDPNIIATVHYYGEWVYSANLGKTGFDEVLWGEDYTQRTAIDQAFAKVYNQFTKNGVGVVIGEYGLLGYDSGSECLQTGEELKYYEYANKVARDYGLTLMLWDNGSMMDRNNSCAGWKNPLIGEWLRHCQKGRNSYATGLDTIYLKQQNQSYAIDDVKIPLTLNGNSFTGIKDGDKELVSGKDYTYDQETATVTLKKDYVKEKVKKAGENDYGEVAALTFSFDKGASWMEYIRTCKDAEYVAASAGDENAPVRLSIKFNGNKVRRVTAYNSEGTKIGPNSSWWEYLQYKETYEPDYDKDTLTVTKSFFHDGSVPATGEITFKVEMYNGDIKEYTFNRTADGVTMVKPEQPQETEQPQQTEAPQQTVAPQQTEAPQQTVAPQQTEAPQQTVIPQPTAQPQQSVKVSFKKYKSTMEKGKKATFVATLSGAKGTVTYASSNASIISINAKTGVAKAKKAGSAKITATYSFGRKSYTASVKVKVVVPASSIRIRTTSSNKNVLTVKKGSAYTLDVKASPADTTDKLKFSTSNKKVATVSGKGKITAKKTGTAKITVKAGKKKAAIKVRVVAKNVPTKTLRAQKKITIKKGRTASIKAVVTPTYTTDKLTYKSSKKSVASVSRYGIVTARKKGTAYITVRSGKKAVKVKVVVK